LVCVCSGWVCCTVSKLFARSWRAKLMLHCTLLLFELGRLCSAAYLPFLVLHAVAASRPFSGCWSLDSWPSRLQAVCLQLFGAAAMRHMHCMMQQPAESVRLQGVFACCSERAFGCSNGMRDSAYYHGGRAYPTHDLLTSFRWMPLPMQLLHGLVTLAIP
jgi:hypothetical protein